MTKIEEAARAICEVHYPLWNATNAARDLREFQSDVGRDFFEEARAVLRAVREPSRGMLEGYIRSKGYDPYKVAETIDEQLLGLGVVAGWRDMIDAMLDETEKETR